MTPTIDDILGYPEAKKMREILMPITYDVFVARLYEDMNSIIQMLQDSASLNKDSSEDLLTTFIVCCFKCKLYDASHDTYVNGHLDLIIKKGNFKWIGEAKIFSTDYKWLFKGMLQILKRYSSGAYNETESALIIYFFEGSVKTKMHSWKNKLSTFSKDSEFKDGIGLEEIKCSIEKDLKFTSTHSHPNSGLKFNTRHIPVLMHSEPIDPLVEKHKFKK